MSNYPGTQFYRPVAGPTPEKFSIIVADPPWRYRNWSDSKNGAASSAMETMESSDIAKIPVESWAAEDSVLLMWATWPKLEDALSILRAWGFKYVTGFPWIKLIQSGEGIKEGIGFWTRSVSEMVLVGKRGNPIRQTKRDKTPVGILVGDDRVFFAPRGSEHSEKPKELQEWITEMFLGDKLELFARRELDDWTCWGYKTGYKILCHEPGVEKLAITETTR